MKMEGELHYNQGITGTKHFTLGYGFVLSLTQMHTSASHAPMHSPESVKTNRRVCALRKSDIFKMSKHKWHDEVLTHIRHNRYVTYLSLKHASIKTCKCWQNLGMHRNGTVILLLEMSKPFSYKTCQLHDCIQSSQHGVFLHVELSIQTYAFDRISFLFWTGLSRIPNLLGKCYEFYEWFTNKYVHFQPD